MLATYLFRCSTLNAPFHSQIFLIFFASGGKGGIDPSNQNPADVPVLDVQGAPAELILYAGARDHSRCNRKLSPTLATARYSCPDNAFGLLAQYELSGYIKLD